MFVTCCFGEIQPILHIQHFVLEGKMEIYFKKSTYMSVDTTGFSFVKGENQVYIGAKCLHLVPQHKILYFMYM